MVSSQPDFTDIAPDFLIELIQLLFFVGLTLAAATAAARSLVSSVTVDINNVRDIVTNINRGRSRVNQVHVKPNDLLVKCQPDRRNLYNCNIIYPHWLVSIAQTVQVCNSARDADFRITLRVQDFPCLFQQHISIQNITVLIVTEPRLTIAPIQRSTRRVFQIGLSVRLCRVQ